MAYVFGNIVFERPAESPESESYNKAHTYVELKPATGKPILQRKGQGLMNLTVSMYFHSDFCDPSDYINRLFAMMDGGEVVEFYHDNGEFRGNFAILDIQVRAEKRYPNGSLMSATVDVTLKEYSEAQFLKVAQDEAAAAMIPDPDDETEEPFFGSAGDYTDVDASDIVRQ